MKSREAEELDSEARKLEAARKRTPETALIIDTLSDLLWNPDGTILSQEERERIETALVGYGADLGKVEHSAYLALAAIFEQGSV